MRALLLKLSTLDSDTEAALRVIAYFDALAMRSATAEMIVRGAAAISEATAGLQLPDGRLLQFDPKGSRVPGAPHPAATQHELGGIRAWLERAGEERRPLDDLIVERFALAAKAAAAERPPRAASELSDPGLIEVVLSMRETVAERSVALRRLGLVPGRAVVCVAVATSHAAPALDKGLKFLVGRVSGRAQVRAARLGSQGAMVTQAGEGVDPNEWARTLHDMLLTWGPWPSPTLRCGIGDPVDALDAASGWASARSALRFARARTHEPSIVSADRLGAVLALASTSPRVWLSDRRVHALRELCATESGRVDTDVLEAYLSQGSLRAAGQALHMHHSSVASRLARLEERLDLDFTVQSDLFQARLCLYGLSLLENDDLPTQPHDVPQSY